LKRLRKNEKSLPAMKRNSGTYQGRAIFGQLAIFGQDDS